MAKRGKFSATGEFLNRRLGQMLFSRLLSVMVVERVDYDPCSDVTVVVGINAMFDDVEDEIPTYDIIFDLRGGVSMATSYSKRTKSQQDIQFTNWNPVMFRS